MAITQRQLDRKTERPSVRVRSTAKCSCVPDYVATGDAIGGSCEVKLVGGRFGQADNLGARCEEWQALQVLDPFAVHQDDIVLVRILRVAGNQARQPHSFLYSARSANVIAESVTRFFAKIVCGLLVAAGIFALVSLFGGGCSGGEGWRGGSSVFAPSPAARHDGALSVQVGLNGLSARSDTWERRGRTFDTGRSGWRGLLVEVSWGLKRVATVLAIHRRACALTLTRRTNRSREPP